MKFYDTTTGQMIEAVRFDPDKGPWPAVVQADGMGGYTVYNDLHKGDIRVQPGEWIRIDQPGNIYPIHPLDLTTHYRPCEEPKDEAPKNHQAD